MKLRFKRETIWLLLIGLIILFMFIFALVTSSNDKNIGEKKDKYYLYYELKKLDSNEKGYPGYQLYVSGNKTEFTGYFSKIYQLDNALVFALSKEIDGKANIYLFDIKDRITSFTGKKMDADGDTSIKLKGELIKNINYLNVLEDKIQITSDNFDNDSQYNFCYYSTNSDYVAQYTEEFDYLGNGIISKSKVIKEVTVKDYLIQNDIICE